jgi:LacI family transcriptional regulator
MTAPTTGRVTLLDVAREAGVSRSTVALVLREACGVSRATRARVRSVMERLGYARHRGATNLRPGTAETAGMIIDDLTDPFFAELAIGIEHGLAAAGILPFLATTGESPIQQARVMRTMREHGAAGFVLCPALGTDRVLLREVEDWRLPMVSVMRPTPGARASYVGPDNRRGAEQATAHLLAAGHWRIAFLGGRYGTVVREERVEGYATALHAAGLPVDTAIVVDTAPNRQGGFEALGRILASEDPPTAALCFNDAVAFGVLHGLVLHGLRAGRDLAVVGFDDVRDARYAEPALTTVAVDPSGLGERAAEILVRQIGSPAAEPVQYRGETRLVIRASCGSASCESRRVRKP